MKLTVKNNGGKAEGEVEIKAPEASGVLLREWYERSRANGRTGTAHTKNRAEVSGGGKKPWKQKGTGRARQGSTRAPHWRHGGVIFGPRNERDYGIEMPQQKRRLAAQLLFAKLAKEEKLIVFSSLGDLTKTKSAVTTFKSLGLDELVKVVVVIADASLPEMRGLHNLAGVTVEKADRIDPQAMIKARKVLVSKEFIEALFAEGGDRASA